MDLFNRALTQTLGMINLTAPDEAQSLADLLSSDLIQQDFALIDTVTLRSPWYDWLSP